MKAQVKIAVAVFSLSTLAAGLLPSVQGAEIRWAKDWAAAQQTAKAEKKAIMIDFFTVWCGWCKKLDQDTYTDAKVANLSSRFVSIKLDAEKEGLPLAKQHGVKSFPTILFLNPDGEVLGRISGYLPPGEFMTEMEKVRSSFEDFPKIEEALKKNPKDGEANARMAEIVLGRGKVKEAEERMATAEKAGYHGEALLRLYNAFGDHFQSMNDPPKAISFFRKVAEAEGASASIRSYARISIVACYAQKRDIERARKEAKEFIAWKEALPEHVKVAKQLLERTGGK